MSGEHLVEFLPNSSITTFNNSKYRINKVEVCIWRGGGDQVSSRTRDILQKQQKCIQLSCPPDSSHALSTPGMHCQLAHTSSVQILQDPGPFGVKEVEKKNCNNLKV